MIQRRQLLHKSTLVLLLGRAQLAHGASVVAVRVWPAQDYTRITLESDQALQAQPSFLAEPPRLAVDIAGVALNPALKELVAKVRADDPNIAGIRVGQYAPNIVRLVIDLKQEIKPQIFTLQPVQPYQHRLVLDLYSTRPVDPLAALITERLGNKATAPPGNTVPGSSPHSATTTARGATVPPESGDPLGELLARQANKPLASAQPARKSGQTERLVIIALDPGHGGEDPGAIGRNGTREKDIVLSLARRLRERINASNTGSHTLRAMLTRDGDYFVPLHTRVNKARQVQADLFVSIHADAFFTPRPQGASVFALSHSGASSSAARWMADKENRADLIGGINVQAKDAQLARALLDMSTSAQIKDSLKLGSKMLSEISRVGKLHKPRVEQAGFAVLKAPDIPSVLVEAAFISNPEEEAKLNSEHYQELLADALLRGIESYFAQNPPLARNRSI